MIEEISVFIKKQFILLNKITSSVIFIRGCNKPFRTSYNTVVHNLTSRIIPWAGLSELTFPLSLLSFKYWNILRMLNSAVFVFILFRRGFCKLWLSLSIRLSSILFRCIIFLSNLRSQRILFYLLCTLFSWRREKWRIFSSLKWNYFSVLFF